MVKVRKDLTGKIFGQLKVLKQAEDYISPQGVHYAQWLCECNCKDHKQIIVLGANLKKKNGTRSCGCLQREVIATIKKDYNEYDMDSYEYGVGYTKKGEPFWFDKEDKKKIENYCWYYSKAGYVVAREIGVSKLVYLHVLVMNVTDAELEVDHKKHPPGNAHKIDNRKSNLEIVTHIDNMKNQGLKSNNKSGITGVHWDEKRKKWVSQIMVQGKPIHLGRYNTKDNAIKARKEAEIKYFGNRRYDANN